MRVSLPRRMTGRVVIVRLYCTPASCGSQDVNWAVARGRDMRHPSCIFRFSYYCIRSFVLSLCSRSWRVLLGMVTNIRWSHCPKKLSGTRFFSSYLSKFLSCLVFTPSRQALHYLPKLFCLSFMLFNTQMNSTNKQKRKRWMVNSSSRGIKGWSWIFVDR